jgi:hypothetical protein
VSDHLAPFALQTAFPPSLAGRDAGDYYEASVAIGLASRRRSHVHPGHTSQRDVGAPLISFNALVEHRSMAPKVARIFHRRLAGLAPVSDVPFRRR